MSLAKGAIIECFKEGTGPAQKVYAAQKPTTDFFKLDMNLSSKTW
jgi:hypothetical protein